MIKIKEPKDWNTIFALSVLHAYINAVNKGRLLCSIETWAKEWHDKYNSPNGTTDADIKKIKEIISYYNASHFWHTDIDKKYHDRKKKQASRKG